MQRKVLLLSTLVLFAIAPLAAQMASSNITAKGISTADLPELNANDWAIYADAESSTYYIDFEQLAVNLNDIVVLDNHGKVLWREEVYDLPVNTIYELDFSRFSPGEYLVELRAYTGVIRKVIAHKG